jgi:hypothetical protein
MDRRIQCEGEDVTPRELYDYASKYARRKEREGLGTQYPTVRQTKRRFRLGLDEIESACADYDGEGYLGIAVAWRGGSGGCATIENPNDYMVEAYGAAASTAKEKARG